ncbi:hypothetical protein [uncultured Bacteroides sp.]|uniref:hypothetical protein n=1 Tax=uncultured Bacteroides sp. TaxID=162156 RepID=UPI002AAB9B99|nr:hypothetical protein [uncultured Bacteroides sp.]
MKRKIFILLLLSTIGLANANSCNTDCYINVDSLFQINLSTLKKKVSESAECVTITNKANLDFLYVISLLSDMNCISSQNNCVDSNTIQAIENWYLKKKKFVTCEKLRKAYSLLRPQVFKSFNEYEEYSKELDQLKIKEE